MNETVLDLGSNQPFVQRATDPVVSNVSTPVDFAAQFPTPLDTTELVTMCEELSFWKFLPEKLTNLKAYTWRELNELAYTSGSSYIYFADGACPEEYYHDGDNTTVTLKNIGAKKSLTISDIMHSMGSIQMGVGISALSGGAANDLPGASGATAWQMRAIADLKEKEVALASALVLNGWDKQLIQGNTSTSALQFDGLENWQANMGVTFHNNASVATGTFSAATFDRFLGEGCATPTVIVGHPAAIQEMLSSYFQLGFAGSQVVNNSSGSGIIPGFNFASFVNTGRGRMQVVADTNFTRTDLGGGKFSAKLWALRMSHNGQPLVYKITQIPLSLRDLAPGCTAISFELWAKTALVVRDACAHSVYTSEFTGNITSSSCTSIG